MERILNVWSEKIPVRFGNVDRSDRITLWSIFDFFQEAAINHAADLGVGRDFLAQNGQAWVLSRFSLFAERRPIYGEVVEVSTWPRKWDRLFALRDYFACDSDGKTIARGRGSWLVLDVEKRRPLRPQALGRSFPLNENRDAFSSDPVPLEPRENLNKTSERSSLYSDIDYYGHTNSARYIQWVQDATDMDVLTCASQFRLDINYLGEIMPGDKIELWTASFEDKSKDSGGNLDAPKDYPSGQSYCFAYEGRRQEDDKSFKTVFRAELRSGGS